MRTLLIENIAELATPVGHAARGGAEQRRVERVRQIELFCRDGRIAFIGRRHEREQMLGPLEDTPRLDAGGRTLIPGFVDPHTHLPWAGSREDEFARRLRGETYQEIAASGGGILSTVRATRSASLEELTANVCARLDRMLRWGATTVEAKSGYGLDLETELKQLRAVREASHRHPVRLVPTLMAAHEVPEEHRGDRGVFLQTVCETIIPRVAADGLAVACDVFCERGVFSVEESRAVLAAGRRAGLSPRLHADEFADSGAAELAAEIGATTADHLMAVSERGIEALARRGVIAGLLPGASFFLRKTWAPARRLIDAGVPVSIGTDCNPGSSPTESMPMMVWLAVLGLGLSIEEALTAATLNAAAALGLADEIGSIEVGKRADLVLLDAPNLLHLAYRFGTNPVGVVLKDGVVVHRGGEYERRPEGEPPGPA